ncbi:hypothetical protein SE17_09935 [Kouleothrix aurantiaca]|uniref:Uncharacterized protein n=1 Tax=Kouleothrix aurantiaca TaxID=186479 RepID=A0A0P9D2X6_9CHLR|nr:hypothetical protein SE17_09935 [Kouleothrix aurantiaca]
MHSPPSDYGYQAWLAKLQARFASIMSSGQPIYTSGVGEQFYTVFFQALPDDLQPVHRCHACRDFFETYGSLITIAADGTWDTPIWDIRDTPPVYQPAVTVIRRLIRKSLPTGVFYSANAVWGNPGDATWQHFSLVPPASLVWDHPAVSAAQAMAMRRQEFALIARAVAEVDVRDLALVIRIIKAEQFPNSEASLAMAEWLIGILRTIHQVDDPRQIQGILWRAVATAPSGFAHIATTALGGFLSDLKDGIPLEVAQHAFERKLDPASYQRPQAAPSAGNVAVAERLVAETGIEAAFARRYARIEDLTLLWRQLPAAPPAVGAGGVFGGVETKQAQRTRRDREYVDARPLAPISMTFRKFRDEVLPTATSIQCYLPPQSLPFAALLTAVDPNAPLIFQWSNAVSWYTYINGSDPSQWGLAPRQWHTITGVCLQPNLWSTPAEAPNHGNGVFFLIHGAQDSNAERVGLTLYPSLLRSVYRPIRATIEAYSKTQVLSGADEATACGYYLHAGKNTWNPLTLRVVDTNGIASDYLLDRWD